ncbi:unnamed protein product [Clavelina lepadiformis]|uniref:Uncharacterized protein n=1 Tax=Clavelina lepadiformis TaxID=159417 RepID=A0ABP0FS44_CLALP
MENPFNWLRFRTVKAVSEPSNLRLFSFHINGTMAIAELVKFLLEKSPEGSYVLTKRLNQDPLEAYFGHMRQTGRRNEVPDIHQYAQFENVIMCKKNIKSLKGSNVNHVIDWKHDIPQKRRIWIEALKSQLVRFEKMQFSDWSDVNNQRRYISLLCELNESSDMELFNMASQRFPTELHLSHLKLSSSEAAIFCDVLRKQRNELKELGLSRCFSPGDVESLISAISEMPGKVKELYISDNIIKDIPGPEFFAKIEEYLNMIGCFEDERIANSSEKQKIQLALDQLHGSDLHLGRDSNRGLMRHRAIAQPDAPSTDLLNQ